MNKKHRFFYALLRPIGFLVAKFKFGYRYERVKNIPESYIVLSNHVTDYDPILVGLSFDQMYFVSSEHITRWGWIYKLLKFIFEPIIRYKATIAASTVMDIMRKVRKGYRVCIFAEGVRTWDGVSSPIVPATAKLIKACRCKLITYKIEGGYFASPNWASSANTRRGHLYGAPVKIYSKEEIAAMSEEELDAVIRNDLYENAYEKQKECMHRYRGRKLAEGMESLVFICPECNGYGTFTSKGDCVTCKACQSSFTYDEYGMLHGTRFSTLLEFNDWQKEQVARDVEQGKPYTVEHATLSTVAQHEATEVASGKAEINSKALRVGDHEILLSSIPDLAIHGRHCLVFSDGTAYYELRIPHGDNILRMLYYYNNCKKNT